MNRLFTALLCVIISGCLGTNRQITGSNERIWWREKNAPEWSEFINTAPIDSDTDLTINIAPIQSHTCPVVVNSVIKFDLEDE